MVNIRITLQLKRQVWHIVACAVDCAEDRHAVLLPVSFKRKFFSQEAAVDYVTRGVARRLEQQPDEAGRPPDIICSVTVNS